MMTTDQTAFDHRLAQLKALAEPTRLRLIRILSKAELTVSELTVVVAQSQPGVSRHLKLLNETGLAERHQEGTLVFYRASPSPILDSLLADLTDDAFVDDEARLASVQAERRAIANRYFADHAGAWDRERRSQGASAALEAAVLAAVAAHAASFGGRLPRLVDLGTGTARMLVVLDGLYEEALGFDVSSEMLSVARANLDTAGIARARVRRADMMTLGEDARAPLILLHHVLHFLPDPAAAVTKALALGSGGRVLVADAAPHEDETLREDHAHRRLGFSDGEVARWTARAGGRVLSSMAVASDAPAPRSKLWVLEGPATVPATPADHREGGCHAYH